MGGRIERSEIAFAKKALPRRRVSLIRQLQESCFETRGREAQHLAGVTVMTENSHRVWLCLASLVIHLSCQIALLVA